MCKDVTLWSRAGLAFPYSYIQILRLNGHFWGWSVTSSVTRLTRILLKASDSREACPPSRTMSDKVPLSLRHICFGYSDNQKLNFSSAADTRASQVQSKVHVSFNSSVFIKNVTLHVCRERFTDGETTSCSSVQKHKFTITWYEPQATGPKEKQHRSHHTETSFSCLFILGYTRNDRTNHRNNHNYIALKDVCELGSVWPVVLILYSKPGQNICLGTRVESHHKIREKFSV